VIQPERVAAGLQTVEQVRHGRGGLDRDQPIGETGLKPLQELRAGLDVARSISHASRGMIQVSRCHAPASPR
jgi:hypothetical protein